MQIFNGKGARGGGESDRWRVDPMGDTPAIARRGGQVAVVSPFLFQAAFDCAPSSTVGKPSSSRLLGLAPGESAVSPYPEGSSGATPSPCPRTVSFLLRGSRSRPTGSHPSPRLPERGLSSAVGCCQHGPPSAALRLLAGPPTRSDSITVRSVPGEDDGPAK